MVVASKRTLGWVASDDFAPANARLNVSVVIPALNDAARLPYILSRIPRWIDEIVLVDGCSNDSTVDLARQVVPNVVVVVEQGRSRKTPWWRRGVAASRGEIIVILDAHGPSDPAEIPLLIGALLAGADFVVSSRFLSREPTDNAEWDDRLGSGGSAESIKLSRFNGRFIDLCRGYMAFWRDALPLASIEGEGGLDIRASLNVQLLNPCLRIAGAR